MPMSEGTMHAVRVDLSRTYLKDLSAVEQELLVLA